ncbi:hypothetical protein VKT23_000187 [Stygiomarasmius scandens]|uniref:Uncharacterized protein n=1 Tax=Marasmiellus scandens TaxID=2682957 RepID=A0ABR1K3R8_9AGAR
MLGHISPSLAPVTNSAKGVTFQNDRYEKTIENVPVNVFDTVGLNEGAEGRVASVAAVEGLYRLLRSLDHVNLLAYVMRGSRFTPTTLKNYQVFHDIMCEGKVPIVAVFTHLENHEPEMEDWWPHNRNTFDKANVRFNDVACITTIRGKNGVFVVEYERSKVKLEGMLLQRYSPQGWVPNLSNGKKGWFKNILRKVFSNTPGLVDNIAKALMRFGDISQEDAKKEAQEIYDRVEKEKEKNHRAREREGRGSPPVFTQVPRRY